MRSKCQSREKLDESFVVTYLFLGKRNLISNSLFVSNNATMPNGIQQMDFDDTLFERNYFLEKRSNFILFGMNLSIPLLGERKRDF